MTELVFDPIVQDCLVLVMEPRMHALYADLSTDEFLRSVPWVLREEGSGTRDAMERSLARFQIPLQTLTTSITVRNAGAMARCVRAGMGAAITSAITVADSLRDGSLVTIDLPGLHLERSFYVVHNKRRSLFPAALKLIAYLKSSMQQLASAPFVTSMVEHASNS